jgi:formiminoglutamase
MEERTNDFLDSAYQPPVDDWWKGRPSAEEGLVYWYQNVHLHNFALEGARVGENDVCLLGYACDQGIERNLGRPGAAKGPEAIRRALGKLPCRINNLDIIDLGDISGEKSDLESCHIDLSKVVTLLLDSGNFPIVLGGGHDVSLAHYLGIKGSELYRDKVIGILNFDAHFDLRKPAGEITSGTPFYQIHEYLAKTEAEFRYQVLGIQEQGNTPLLFKTARSLNVRYLDWTECQVEILPAVIKEIDNFLLSIDYLYVTIDMDGFSSAFSPGVSAPSPLGLEPVFVLAVLRYLFDTKKVIAFDVVEHNPVYDRDGATAKLAAILIDHATRYLDQNS